MRGSTASDLDVSELCTQQTVGTRCGPGGHHPLCYYSLRPDGCMPPRDAASYLRFLRHCAEVGA